MTRIQYAVLCFCLLPLSLQAANTASENETLHTLTSWISNHFNAEFKEYKETIDSQCCRTETSHKYKITFHDNGCEVQVNEFYARQWASHYGSNSGAKSREDTTLVHTFLLQDVEVNQAANILTIAGPKNRRLIDTYVVGKMTFQKPREEARTEDIDRNEKGHSLVFKAPQDTNTLRRITTALQSTVEICKQQNP